MGSIRDLKIKTKLLAVAAVAVTGFIVFDYLGWRTMDFLKVNGPVYKSIIQGKDVIADVLPPPKYIIESYLIAHHMLIEKRSEDMEKLFQNSYRLEKEYIERQQFWLDSLAQGQLKDELTRLSHQPAMEFFKLRNEEFFPLIIQGEIEKARELLDERMEPFYDEHRAHIDRVVEIAKGMNEENERLARKLLHDRMFLLALWGIFIVVIGISLLLYFVNKITSPLSRITRAAKRISEGDLSEQDIVVKSKDEIGDLSRAIEQMRIALQRTISGLQQKITEHKQAREELLVSRGQLEARVSQRTEELEKANNELRLEVAERKKMQSLLNVQYEIARFLAVTSSSEAVSKVLQLVCENLNWDFAELWNVDWQANLLRYGQGWYRPYDELREFEMLSREVTFAPGKGLPGSVWLDKKPVWIPDVRENSNFPRAAAAVKCGLYCAFCFPIFSKDEVLGVVAFFSRDVRPPDDEMMRLFYASGDQLGQFIERVQAQEEAKKLNAELEKRVAERTALFEAAHEELQEANTLNQLLLETIPFGMDIVDEEGNIIAVSSKMEMMFGKGIIGKKCWSLYKDDRAQCPKCPLKDGISDGQIMTYETSGLMGGRIFQITHSPMIYKGKKAVLEIFQDITERKKQEEDLKEMHEKLKNIQLQMVQSAKMASLGQLAGGIAHEINNPLTGVLNSVQLIKMLAKRQEGGLQLPQLNNILEVIEESALRCASITHSLLDLSYSGKVDFQAVSLNEVAGKIIQLIANEFKLQNVSIEKNLQSGLPYVRGNPQLLQQVIFDILVNARWAVLKKSPLDGGVITIKSWYEPENNNVLISISDTGIGINEENLEKIFDPFFTTKPVGEGTGLGLSIVYSIIKQHGGSITAQSSPGEGATFKISLPVYTEKNPQ